MIALFDIDNWREIGATLSRNKTRTFLTAFGIFWGTVMLALLWGGTQGLRQMLSANFAGFATNSAIMFSSRTTMPYKGYQKGTKWDITQTDVDIMRQTIPEIDVISPVIQRSTTTRRNDKTKTNIACGVDQNYMNVLNPVVTQGRFINQSDVANARKVAVIGTNVAALLFPGENPIGQFVEADNVFYRVIGVARQQNEMTIGERVDDSLIIPQSTMRRTYNLGQNIDGLLLVAKQGYTPTEIRPKIDRAIRKSHPIHPDDSHALVFWDISEQFKMADNLFTGVNVLVLFVGLSSLLAGIIGVGNIMWIIVRERTQEFGIRRAMGALPSNLIVQILSESMVLTLVAGMAGICFAVLVLGVATMVVSTISTSGATFQLTFSKAMTILVLFLTLGTAAGLLPAIKAMKIKPIEALNNK